MSIAAERMDTYGFQRAMEYGGRSATGIFDSDPPSERRIGCVDEADPECRSSSSIGKNSDEDDGGKSSDGGDSGENEAESTYKGPMGTMDSLEEVLPIGRGISKFYNGKSKSFTSLVEASSSSSSIKDISKPENAYSRRRRNLLNHHLWDKNRISKRYTTLLSSSKSTLALALAVTSSSEDSSSGSSPTASGSPTRLLVLPPLHPQTKAYSGNFTSSPPARGAFCAWRSYSVADLPRCLP